MFNDCLIIYCFAGEPGAAGIKGSPGSPGSAGLPGFPVRFHSFEALFRFNLEHSGDNGCCPYKLSVWCLRKRLT